VGVTSYGYKCAQEKEPDINTRVSQYIEWIQQNVVGATTTTTHTTLTPPTTTTTEAPADTSAFNYTGCGVHGPVRIVGGGAAQKGEWPMMAYVTMGEKDGGSYTLCGGTILTDQCVLTAAHCISKSKASEIRVYGGVHERSKRFSDPAVQIRDVVKSVAHKNFGNSEYSDVGVLKLSKKFTLNKRVNTACLPNPANTYAGVKGTAVGWGRTSHGGSTSDVLKDVSYPIISNQACNSIPGGFSVYSSYICAKSSNSGTCGGDSGGPLFVEGGDGKWSVVGVNSFSGSSSCINPDYFMRVSSFTDWIKTNCA